MTIPHYIVFLFALVGSSFIANIISIRYGRKSGYEKAEKALEWKVRDARNYGVQEGYNEAAAQFDKHYQRGVEYGQHHPKRDHGKFVSPDKA